MLQQVTEKAERESRVVEWKICRKIGNHETFTKRTCVNTHQTVRFCCASFHPPLPCCGNGFVSSVLPFRGKWNCVYPLLPTSYPKHSPVFKLKHNAVRKSGIHWSTLKLSDLAVCVCVCATTVLRCDGFLVAERKVCTVSQNGTSR